MLKKLCLILLACSVIFSLLPGCGVNENEQEKNLLNENNSGNNNQIADTTENLTADLPDNLNFNDETFTFIVTGPEYGSGYYETIDIYAEEQNATTLNDAVYLRNRSVEALLNVEIAETKSNNVPNDITKAVLADEDIYNASFVQGYEYPKLVQSGYFLNIKDIQYIDLEKPWWDKNFENEMTIRGKLYFTTGDISTMVKACTRILIFNKQLIQDFGLDNPYDHVKNDTWTFDVYAQFGKSIYVDVNGSGIPDDGDVYGILREDTAATIMMLNFGERITKNDANGYPQIIFHNDRMITAANKLFDLYYDNISVRKNTLLKPTTGYTNVWTFGRSLFAQDKFLFHFGVPLILDEFRNMESEFGLLPWPKLDEGQTRYYHAVDISAVLLGVPVTVINLEMAGAVLEAMAAESMYTVAPAYNEIMLKRKYVRDAESEFILDLVNETRTYDLASLFRWGNMDYLVIDVMDKDSRSISSEFEKRYESTFKAIETTMTAFDDLK